MNRLHHVVTFSSTFPDGWQFDANGDPSVAGGRECIEFLRSQLLTAGFSVNPICERDYYGWEFTARYQRATFYFVLTAVDSFYFHFGVELAALQTVLLRRPAQPYERLRAILDEVFHQSGHFSDVRWFTRSAFEAEQRKEALKARAQRLTKRSRIDR